MPAPRHTGRATAPAGSKAARESDVSHLCREADGSEGDLLGPRPSRPRSAVGSAAPPVEVATAPDRWVSVRLPDAVE